MSGVFTIEEFEKLIKSSVSENIIRVILVCIQADANKFKYYIMEFDEDNNKCDVKFGRIGAVPQTHSYSFEEGLKKKKEKMRKGYDEITEATYKAGFSQYGNLAIE